MRIEDVNYCPRCAAALESKNCFGKDRPVCPACGWVFFDDPKVAVAVLVQRAGSVLLVQRANSPFQGQWTLPAGFVDAGEDPQAAAVRECLEETGLVVEISALIGIVSGREHPRGSDLTIFYRAECPFGEPLAGDDAAAAAWFKPENLPELAFQSTRKILKQVLMLQ